MTALSLVSLSSCSKANMIQSGDSEMNPGSRGETLVGTLLG